MPLRRRLLLSSLLGVVPLILLGLVLIGAYYRDARTHVLQQNIALARVGAVYVQGWVDGNLRTLRTLAGSNEVLRGTLVDMQGLVTRQLRQQPDWESLFITDANGVNISYTPAPGAARATAADREYFRRARATGAPVVSNILTSQVTNRISIIVAYPVHRDGRFGGIVAAVIHPQELQTVFGQFDLPMETIAALWGSDRRLIARTDTPVELIGQSYPGTENNPMFSGHPGNANSTSPITGKPTIIGYVPVRGTTWIFLISTPLNVVLAPLYRTLALFLVLTFFVLGLTLASSLYSASYLSRLIASLAASAREIGSGNFAIRVHSRGGLELEALATSINMMAANLAVIDRLKSDLLSMVSHELKTPLTTIGSALEMINAGVVPLDDPRARELLTMAERQSERLQDIIENLLSAARQQAGGLAVAPRPSPLRPIILAAVAQFEAAALRRGLTLTVEMPDDLQVMAEPPRAALALNNLLDNAVKFTETGSITVRVTREEDEVVIAVIDTGAGFTPEVRSHLFERFYQAEPLLTRKAGGAGLGLFIVKAIAEAHGGHVFAESTGHSSTFGFTLPLAE